MPFKKVRRFFKKAEQATTGMFNRDAEQMHGFECLESAKSLTLEINDWEPFTLATEAYIAGNKTEFSPVYMSIYQAPEHTLLYRVEIDPDELTIKTAEDKDNSDDSKLITLKLPDDKDKSRPAETPVFDFIHGSGLILFNVTQLDRQKNRFRVYQAGDDDQQPHLRVIKGFTINYVTFPRN